MNLLYVQLTAAVVVIGLGFLLTWTSPLITSGAYRVGFFMGLAAFASILFSSGSWYFRIGSGRFPYLALVPFTFLAVTPYLLLLESGIAGYRGFSSWVRYVSIAVGALGGLGLVASFLLPRLLRR